jgi:spoIIIJ-associated protein
MTKKVAKKKTTKGKAKQKKKVVKKIVKKSTKDNLVIVEKLAVKLLKLMKTNVEVKISEDKNNEAIMVDIQTEDEVGLIIGNRGRTLNSIQTLLGMMYRQETGEWQRILVNVADWREKEQDRLEQLAQQTAERARTSSEPQYLYNLTSAQRRIVHLVLSGEKDIETESLGEGRDRYLVVNLKK